MNMRRVAAVLVCAFLAPLSAHSAERKPLTGWGTVRFGMSHDEVSRVLNGQVYEHGPYILNHEVTIEGSPFEVIFFFVGKNNTLTNIQISNVARTKSSELCAENRIQKFAPSLKAKYGEPDSFERHADTAHTTYIYDFPNALVTYGTTLLDDKCIFTVNYRLKDAPKPKATF